MNEERKEVYVLQEMDNGNYSTLGILDNTNKVESFMNDYYRTYDEISHSDIRDSGIEWVKVIEILDLDETSFYKVVLTLQSFILF